MKLKTDFLGVITPHMIDVYDTLSDDMTEVFDPGDLSVCEYLHCMGYLEMHSIPVIIDDKPTGKFKKWFKKL